MTQVNNSSEAVIFRGVFKNLEMKYYKFEKTINLKLFNKKEKYSEILDFGVTS